MINKREKYYNGINEKTISLLIRYYIVREKCIMISENEGIQMTFSDLKSDTNYLVRIIIKDLKLKAQQTSDDLIPFERVSTDCDGEVTVGII